MRYLITPSVTPHARPVTWYRRTADTFKENILIEKGVAPEDVAKTISKQAKKVINKGHSAGIWYDERLLAAIEKDNGVLYVRVVPSMRDYVALPWRNYG